MRGTKKKKTRSRIYVCHTYYHVYVAVLKEMKLARDLPAGKYKKADIALSSISTDFEHLGDRLAKTGIFHAVIALDEKREDFFPELAKYRKNYSNILRHMVNRMIFTKKLAKCEIPYLSAIDFAAYEDIYVFCDSDPVGYYLNYKHIYYHAVEDGLDCLKNLDDAYVANHGHFKLKTLFSRMNLIFIMNGWGKYCIDMEINDRSVVPTDCPRFVDVEARKRVCLDVIERYCEGCRVLIKPHPRDGIDYGALCPDAVVLRGRFPVEVLNFFEGLHIRRAVSIVTTAMNNMDFVEEKLNLGASFWDAYEDPEKHEYNRKAGLSLADK